MTSGGPAGEPSSAERPLRVLLAEDEVHLGALLAQFLQGRGLDVVHARDGREALAALAGRDVDVAVTDVQMPGLDGFALLAAARALPLPPEVVVITGNASVELTVRALREGAYDCLAKPYRMAELELRIRRAGEKRALRAAEARAGAAPSFLATPGLADVVAAASAPDTGDDALVLVGESGTGRRTLAAWLRERGHARRAVRVASPGETHVGGRRVAVPALRARPEDVLPLARHLAAHHVGASVAFTTAAEAALAARAWPGNVAELAAVVRAAVDRAAGASAIDVGHLEPAR